MKKIFSLMAAVFAAIFAKINLQLFADGDQGNVYNDSSLTMSTTSNIADPYDGSAAPEVNRLSPEMKEYYSNYLIKLVGPNLIHGQLLDEEPLPAHLGDTVVWRKMGKFKKALKPLVEGITPVASVLKIGDIRKRLYQYGDWSMVTDRLSMTAIDDIIVEYTQAHADNAGGTIDTVTREEIHQGITSEAFAGGVELMEELNSKITPKDVLKVATYLKNNNAPKVNGSYLWVIHPSVSADLMSDEMWIDVNKYSNTTKIFEGEIGKIYGVRFIETTEAKAEVFKFGSGDNAETNATVVSYSSANSSYVITIGSGILSSDDFEAGDKIMIHDVSAEKLTVEELTIASIDASAGTITLSAAPTITPAAGDILYVKGAPVDGKTLYSNIVVGAHVGKKTTLSGKGNMEMIVKTDGGTSDPLNQRKTIGWKVPLYGAAITIPDYGYKYYCVSDIDLDESN